jgi:hypothetical protein
MMGSSKGRERIRIFQGRDELFCLVLPLIFFVPALFVQASGPPFTGYFTWLNMAAAYLGMNLIHTAFTFPLLSFPELKEWSVEQLTTNRRNIALRLGIALSVLVIYFQVESYLSYRALLGSAAEWGASFFSVIVFVHFLIAEKHSMGHSFGLSGLYNRRLCDRFAESSRERKNILSLERLEQRLFGAFLLIVVIVLGMSLVGINFPGRVYFFSLILFMAFLLNALPFFYPGYRESNKKFFQLRLFLYPLALYFPLCFVVIAVKHGTESLCVYRKILSNSKLEDRARKLRFTYLASVVVAVLGLFSFKTGVPGFAMTGIVGSPSLFIFLGGLSSAITFFHYYVDGLLYHFSDPVTRKHISPLVV